VKRRLVQFTATARRHVLRERDWWAANREHVEIFASDLNRAIDLIAKLPGVSSRYAQAPGMHRVFHGARRLGPTPTTQRSRAYACALSHCRRGGLAG
jgi:hypothetical protein